MNEKWNNNYQKLKKSIETTGHLPTTQKDDPILRTWYYNQRRNKANLTEEQQRLLEELLGFTWEINRQLSWEERYQEILDIIQETGKPLKYRPHQTKYMWLYKQRKNKANLTLEQQHKLEALPGFTWGIEGKLSWEERYQEVVSIIKRTRELPTFTKHQTQYMWLWHQCKRNKNLTEEQQRKLEALPGVKVKHTNMHKEK